MADPAGVLAKAAVKRPVVTSVWGDAATSVTNQIPLKSESMTTTLLRDIEEMVEGQVGRTDADIVGNDEAGTITTDLWYEGLEYLFYAAFGFECPTVYSAADYGSGTGGSPAPDTTVSPDAYHHVMEPDDTINRAAWVTGERAASSGSPGDATYWTAADLKNRCFDLGILKGVPSGSVHRFKNCMVKSMTVKATLEEVAVEWELVAYDRDTNTMNYTNWVLPTERARAVFPHLHVGLSAAGGSAPSTINVQEITLKLENPLNLVRESGTYSDLVSEPIRDGSRKVSGSIKLARYDSDTFPTALRAGTDLQLDLKFVHPTIITGSAFYPTIEFICPLVKLTKAEFPVTGPGVISGDLEFEAFITATPAWVTTLAGGISLVHDQEIYLMFRNTRGYCWSRDNQTVAVGALP